MTSGVSILRGKLRRFGAQLSFIPQATRLVWTAAPRQSAIWFALLAVNGLLPIAVVYTTRALVNSIVAAAQTPDGTSGSYALSFVALMGLLLVIGEGTRAGIALVRTSQSDLVQDYIADLIHSKSVEIDLAFYDQAEFYDHLHRARSEASYRPAALVENIGAILQNGITTLSMVVVLIPFGPWLPIALVLSRAPALYAVIRYALDQHYWRLRTTSDERRTWYYDWVLTASETAAEIRLFGLGKHFQSAFRGLRGRLRKERLQLARKQAGAEVVAGFVALLTSGTAMVWMAWRALHGRITLGDLALFYQALQQGMRLSRTLLENIGQLYANSLFLGNLFEFLALESKVTNATGQTVSEMPRGDVRFRGVTFRYPGSEVPALAGLDLEVARGGITAIVGTNGAGKSTLMKLLCRFYDPDEGSIEIGGVDLKRMDLTSLRGSITVLFQQPVHYNATAAQNIGIGEVGSAVERGAIEAAAEAAGADEVIRRLPGGFDHLLGRWFENGTELSSGEWQRIALARAFRRKASILILDEPTSAMDPWAEAEWLSRFRKLAEGRTTIIITHRFSTASIADRVAVLRGGCVVESGSHEELVTAGGLYAQGWSAHVRSAVS